MELENIILSEVTQSQKNTHGMHSLISGHYPRSLEYPRHNYKMMSKKEEGEAPGPGKARCSSIGEYQGREMGGGSLGNWRREEGLWDLWEGAGTGKGKIIWNVNIEYRKMLSFIKDN